MIGLALLGVIQLSVYNRLIMLLAPTCHFSPFFPLPPQYIHTKRYGLEAYISIPSLGTRLALVTQTFAEMNQAKLWKVYAC